MSGFDNNDAPPMATGDDANATDLLSSIKELRIDDLLQMNSDDAKRLVLSSGPAVCLISSMKHPMYWGKSGTRLFMQHLLGLPATHFREHTVETDQAVFSQRVRASLTSTRVFGNGRFTAKVYEVNTDPPLDRETETEITENYHPPSYYTDFWGGDLNCHQTNTSQDHDPGIIVLPAVNEEPKARKATLADFGLIDKKKLRKDRR